ncbi:lipase class 3 family protein [Musa troglodytarum]|uniref:Lipase class 3 family protein n=1 Tax=Musa troglodytarum TaxID=320322 RepID=A0A9E7FUM7_9LILI|nr:lipase class 3 family protein [Musa troglodytarum]
MATATMATAAGAAALLYYTLNRRLQATRSQDHGECEHGDDAAKPLLSGRNRVSRRPVRAPATWLETISTLSETLRFTYSETLGKWPIGDLAFGINFLLKRQGNLHVAKTYAGNGSIQLRGAQVITELKYLLNLLTLCWHFSKKPFPLFLEATGYSQDDVILQEPKAGILKPAFTILIDKSTKCILLLIRGTHSIRDTLTAATGAVVPFHHTVMNEGGVSDLVLGYAHCGMVAAAQWIAKLAGPCLMKVLHEYPEYQLQIVGHSLGGGTAALLTYILREQQDLATTTCVTFAPAACMTWELAESGKHFITSVVNGADLVPTFSAASVDDLRSEVTASAWLNDLRNQIEHTRILSTVYRSASALGSRLPSIATARARVAGAGAILRPISNKTQVVVKTARSVARAAWAQPPLRLSSWSCIGPRHRSKSTVSNSRLEESISGSSLSANENSEALASSTETTTLENTEIITSQGVGWTTEYECSQISEISHAAEVDDTEDDSDSEDLMGHGRIEDKMTEVELWQQLENELYRTRQNKDGDLANENEDADLENEIREDQNPTAAEESGGTTEGMLTEAKQVHRFYPPGKIMHVVSILPEGTTNQEDPNDGHDNGSLPVEPKFGIFLTPRSLYGKLRLSQTMINDHYMPMYRRNIEQVISELEKDTSSDISGDGTIL